jgi:hypothetical protein
MKRLPLLVLVLGLYSSYSYSEVISGTTSNATDFGYNWVMRNILPQQAGLEVSSVYYRYSVVKNTEDDMVVYVQNEDAQNEGQYIFREVDDWSGRRSNTINKILPVNNILIDRWGDGSIEWTGQGTVEDSRVVYNYRYDPCFDPQSSPDCPGYVPPIPDIPEPDLTALYEQEQKFIDEEAERKAEIDEEEQEERDRRRVSIQKNKERLEIALGGINSALMTSEAELMHDKLIALGLIPPAYIRDMSGGSYEETVTLKDGKLPINKKGRRVGLAQQKLHEEMINSQYKN